VFLLAAAQPSLWDYLQRIPRQTWINVLICVVAVVVIVRVWAALKRFNDFAPYFVAAVAAALIFFYWIYDRTEPKFLSPLIDQIAPFFPSGVRR
jgi:purine-cytosine permease-like protein